MMLLLKSVESGSIDRHGDCFRNILMAATVVTLTVHILMSDGDKPEVVMKKLSACTKDASLLGFCCSQ